MNIACSGIQLSVSTLKNTFSCSFVSPQSLIISTNRGIITIYELRRLAFTMGWWRSPPFKTSYYYDLPSNDLANYRLHLTPTFKSLCLQQRHARWERNVFQPWDSGGSHLPKQSRSAEHGAHLCAGHAQVCPEREPEAEGTRPRSGGSWPSEGGPPPRHSARGLLSNWKLMYANAKTMPHTQEGSTNSSSFSYPFQLHVINFPQCY